MSKKNIIIFILIILAIVVLAIIYGYGRLPAASDQAAAPANQANGPAIQISPDFFDLGIVKYGDVAEHIFTIENIGDQALEILKLSTSCGCTKAMVADSDKIVAPGKSVNLVVTFDPAVHQDDMDLGEVARVVYIATNDQAKPEIEINLRAQVVKADQIKTIEVTAHQWSFDPNPIRVKLGDYVQLKISSADVEHGFALPDFAINETIKPGQVTVINFLADQAGSFNFFCSVPCGAGHPGMTGQLIVEQ